ncbi:MAG: VWA domain-containing protein [Candidatus Brocadia sp.]|nr:VWA domain-containing protein [Candidatus Brocadia sp.]
MKKKAYGKIIFSSIGVIIILVAVLIYLGRVEPILEIAPTELDFGDKETKKSLILKNTGEKKWTYLSFVKTLQYEIDIPKDSDWISAYPKSEICEKQEEKNINIVINRDKLPVGINRGEIVVKSNGGNKTIAIVAEGVKEEKTIKIMNPYAGASLAIDEDITIRWSATSNISNYVDILLLQNDSIIEKIISSYNYRNDTTSNGEYKWTPKGPLRPDADKYTLRIIDSLNKDVFAEVSSLRIISPLSKLYLKNITTAHQKPCTLQFIFSLRDQNNHAVLIDPSKFDWKNLKIWENNEEIDYLESRAFLYTQNDFHLQVMLVLDFSASMKSQHNGIETMLTGAKSLIDRLKETHQIGIVEFHRPDEAPLIILPFTTHKQLATDAIGNLANKDIYSDFSICWDAAYKGLNEFPAVSDPKTFRALAFLSDGFDNSSVHRPEDLISLANKRDVHIYVIGLGDVRHQEILENISAKTGGTYVRAENMNVFLERFKQIIEDLGGQYKISYITPKKPADGIFAVKSELTYKGITGIPPLEDKLDPSLIYGKTNQGVIVFEISPFIKGNRAEIFMWCEHVPRYINTFRFRLKTDKPCNISFVSESHGGICDDWNITNKGDGWYQLNSPDTKDPSHDLAFGRSGIICKITIEDIKEKQLEVPFLLDNSVYKLGQSFYGETAAEIDANKNWNKTIIISKKQGQ